MDSESIVEANDGQHTGKCAIADDCEIEIEREFVSSADDPVQDGETGEIVASETSESSSEERSEETSQNSGSKADQSRTNWSSSISSFYAVVMRQHRTEICISLGLLLTVFSSLFHSQFAMKGRLLQRKAPPPVRFFSRNSLVTDLFDGNGLDLYKLLAAQTYRHDSTGILFVMYYAPWCARSMDAKWHMENLARHFYPDSDIYSYSNISEFGSSPQKRSSHSPVHFIAVNCWDPNGQCRQSYRLYSYPIFLAYPGTINGIYYNGILSADYMFRFLENLISPTTRLQTVDQVLLFLHDFKTVAIAYFDFTTHRHPIGYYSFYLSSLKTLERDPIRAAIKFGFITDPDVAGYFEFTQSKQMKLYRGMEQTILDYPDDRSYTSKSISEWIFENLANPVRWVSPSTVNAGKSEVLHQFVTRKPTLILFAPRQPLNDFNPHYTTLTTVALRYFDCSNGTWVGVRPSASEIVKKLHADEKESSEYRRKYMSYCLQSLREEMRLLGECCKDISHFIRISNNSKSTSDYHRQNFCQVCSASNSKVSRTLKMSHQSSLFCQRFFTYDDSSDSMPMEMKKFLLSIHNNRSCDRVIGDILPKSTVLEYCCKEMEGNWVNVDGLIRQLRKRRTHSTFSIPSAHPNCDKLRLSRLLGYGSEDGADETDAYSHRLRHFDGLACRTNRTLQFAAMDRNFYGAFAKKLGLANKSATPAALIVDDSGEAIYLLESPMNIIRLAEFIDNFTYDRQLRFYRSHQLNYGRLDRSHHSKQSCSTGSVSIRTVSSSTFQSVVMDRSTDVLLLYTARWCGPCQRLFHIYQALAYYFRVVNEDITFAQIDVTANDLPWQFTVDTVPVLIFFPSSRKSESIAYPSFAPLTLPNLVAFVLAHCKHETRLLFALSMCARNGTGDGTSADSVCMLRNRHRAWRRMFRIEHRIRRLRLDVDRAIQFSKFDWDHDDNDQQWRVYLNRTWVELAQLETKRRTLGSLLTNALRRTHFG